jgi:hypothetical protein
MKHRCSEDVEFEMQETVHRKGHDEELFNTIEPLVE